ncbi:MAG: hydroxymethylbilane synthase [Desulfobacterales bacterium]|nr:hydroxymethylbilane synthase [Desulfobacterales bacterium]
MRQLMASTIKIGTRGSKLALWQANWVKSALEEKNPSITIEIIIIKTKGDKILDVPLAKVGGKGLFVKEIEEALLDGRIDLAVHSMKDMPAEIPEGLCIGAVPEREMPHDVLISKNGLKLSDLPEGAIIGTSSLRRAAQLRHARPDLEIRTLRGNIETRLNKVKTGDMAATILAAAGVRRMNYTDKITEYIDEKVMLPAVGQGALCIETRENDTVVGPIVDKLDHAETHTVVTAERAFLHRLEGSCQVPVAAHGKLYNNELSLCGLVANVDGSNMIRETITGSPENAETMGVKLANILLSMGARKILDNLKENAQENL